MKKIVYIVFFLIATFCQAQLKTYSFKETESLQKMNPKPLVVFIYADWCKICKMMENTTLKDKLIADKLNSGFYFVKLDGEHKKDIVYNNQKFKYKPTGSNTGVHELAEALGTINGQLAYPTTSILNSKNEIVFQYNKSLSITELNIILNKILEQ